MMAWVWYAVVQLIQLVALIAQPFALAVPILLHLWKFPAGKSIKDGRMIDAWSWTWLNLVYGNPEDGVSGTDALIWDGPKQVRYMPFASPTWRALCWNFRNPTDNLKYVFAWKDGPLKTFTFLGRTAKLGWQMENGFNVPVLSI